MTSTRLSPLHIEAPRLVADAALGEHLATLARASAPSVASRVRRSGWRVPLAAVATIAASSGVAYAGQAALETPRTVASTVTPSPSPTTSDSAAASTGPSAGFLASAGASHAVHANPHGKIVGPGHPKTGKAKGHDKTKKHDEATAGSAGVSSP